MVGINVVFEHFFLPLTDLNSTRAGPWPFNAAAARADAPNEGLPARVNRVGLHRSTRRNSSSQLSLRRSGAQGRSRFRRFAKTRRRLQFARLCASYGLFSCSRKLHQDRQADAGLTMYPSRFQMPENSGYFTFETISVISHLAR